MGSLGRSSYSLSYSSPPSCSAPTLLVYLSTEKQRGEFFVLFCFALFCFFLNQVQMTPKVQPELASLESFCEY